MKKRENDVDQWDTPSLDWIHRVRRERHAERAGRPLRPLSQEESEQLAKRFGVKLTRKLPVGR